MDNTKDDVIVNLVAVMLACEKGVTSQTAVAYMQKILETATTLPEHTLHDYWILLANTISHYGAGGAPQADAYLKSIETLTAAHKDSLRH